MISSSLRESVCVYACVRVCVSVPFSVAEAFALSDRGCASL